MCADTARRPSVVHFNEIPKPPAHEYINDTEPAILIVGEKTRPAFLVTSGQFQVYEVRGKDATLDDAVKLVLDHYEMDEPWLCDAIIWDDSKALAMVRSLPFDGRRVVFYFNEGGKPVRDVFPAHPDFLKNADRKIKRRRGGT